ncbi:Rpn family recombination-promoting nuclease/putative transposase [Phytoactinopolyspora halotolerans]|uniref:Transposase (putative) YhgA-like domain-containing protein n=1 Tax=Phytoactinopolyspora halotolerans TaxID=1981512 RepID=A0A6L9SJ61_9ACTN|nr:Rpn family recombination-promoting nuclease/putative transposase [Phytoactinopolyspora halotolerans]NEE04728.1 hypothetical protein [Phytoactinopolyspora halotolerans]
MRPLGPDADGQWVRRWTSPEWTQTADDWVGRRLAEHDRRIIGEPVTYRARLWSVVRCYPSTEGLVWFKENNPGFRFEAGLLATLAQCAPDDVVVPIVVDRERGWIRTNDQEAMLSRAEVADQPTRRIVVCALARLQCAFLGRLELTEHPGSSHFHPAQPATAYALAPGDGRRCRRSIRYDPNRTCWKRLIARLSVPTGTFAVMSNQSSPHDAAFRRILGEPANAASQLRATLPAALADRLDLDRLVPASTSFIDPALRWRHSDLLFTAPLDGHEAFVYVLVEHQGSTDALMPFRMLLYVVRIWERYLTEHPEATRLPAVIPLVVHHNRRPWSGPTEVLDLLDVDPATAEAAGEYLPRFRFLLDEHALRSRPLTPQARITLLLLKIAAGNARLADDLKTWADDLRAILDRSGGADDFVTLLTYIETVGEAPTDELHDLFARLGPDAEEAYVTTAEMLRAEGEARGRAEGEARGRAETLLQLLTLKFGPLPQTTLDVVRSASTAQLEAWTARVLTADTLDHVLH